jgi:anthranilate phosphoribosyltransferase
MRRRAAAVRCDAPATVDTCGTGGDGCGTINVSTIAAFVAAACGVTVAKHGNRAVSSRAGSADVLEALGVRIDAPPEAAERSLREHGLAFLFAPAYHSATRHVAGPRRELGVRTVFNLLGPLTNPAGARRHVNGIFDPSWCERLAQALGALGSERAFVVHGGGLDEFAPCGETLVAELRDGAVRTYRLAPRDFGLAEEDPAGLAGGDAAHNAAAARSILGGARGAGRTATVMSAAAAVVVAGLESDLRASARRAEAAIDEGRAAAKLEALIAAAPR